MTTIGPQHAWFDEQTAAYLAGGLAGEERRRFEAHAETCGDCGRKLAEASAADERLRRMFDEVQPSAGFEDAIIHRIRAGAAPAKSWRLRPQLHPAVRRAATGVAAAILLGGFGYVGTSLLENHRLPDFAMSLPWGSADKTRHFAMSPQQDQETAFAIPATLPAPADRAKDQIQQTVQSWRFRERDGDVKAGDDQADEKSSDKHGTQIRYGDRHVEFQDNPFVGVNRDNIYSSTPAAPPANTPLHGNDSILLPRDDGVSAAAGGQSLKADVPKAQQPNGDVSRSGRESGKGGEVAAGPAPAAPDYFKPNASAGTSAPLASAGQPSSGGGGAGPYIQFGVTGLANTPAAPAWSVPLALSAPQPSREEQGQPQPAPTQTTPPGDRPAVVERPAPVERPQDTRKIIRTGTMDFEVDSFDSAAMRISKIIGEEGGFVATTDSERLANGKVRGTITVRVPPDHLDTVVLAFRGLGDLKGQKIAAQDVTKEYTDLESELRAARAMEERLLDIVKNGKGAVKDLLEAEKQLGVWREKIEQVTGEINYYNNLVSLSTLSITMTEKDIRQAAQATETESVSVGVETEDVEKARAEALKAITDAKGRIVQSDLKQFEAGQLSATICAEVPPDAAGAVLDRLRQLGHVARLDMGRHQAPSNGGTVVPPGVKIERQDTTLNINLYNLANVAPRETVNLNLACADVSAAYKKILDTVNAEKDGKAIGRVVNSNLVRPKVDDETATVTFEIRAAEADAVLAAVQALGEKMQLTVTENPDTANVTAAKRGFAVTLRSMASVPARETQEETVLPHAALAAAYESLLNAARATPGAHIITANFQEQNRSSISASLDVEIPRELLDVYTKSIHDVADVTARTVTRSADTENTIDSKVLLKFTFINPEALSPRETITRALAAKNVAQAYNDVLAAAQHADAKITTAQLNEQDSQNVNGTLAFVVPAANADAIEKAVAKAGAVVSRTVCRSADQQNSTPAKVAMVLTFGNVEQLKPRQTRVVGAEVSDPEQAMANLVEDAIGVGGTPVQPPASFRDDQGHVGSKVVLNVPLNKIEQLVGEIRKMGALQVNQPSEDLTAPDGEVARARLDVQFVSPGALVGADNGLWATLRNGLSTSARGLLWSLQLIIIGLCLVGPWVLLGWIGWRVFRRRTARTAPEGTVTT